MADFPWTGHTSGPDYERQGPNRCVCVISDGGPKGSKTSGGELIRQDLLSPDTDKPRTAARRGEVETDVLAPRWCRLFPVWFHLIAGDRLYTYK